MYSFSTEGGVVGILWTYFNFGKGTDEANEGGVVDILWAYFNLDFDLWTHFNAGVVVLTSCSGGVVGILWTYFNSRLTNSTLLRWSSWFFVDVLQLKRRWYRTKRRWCS